MEKLTELLREYNMSNQSPYILGDADYYVDDVLYAPQIISKSYGFIEWLVENEKVKDLEEIDYIYGPELVNHQTEIIYTPYGLYESLLMLLAIQDEPINFLISILK